MKSFFLPWKTKKRRLRAPHCDSGGLRACASLNIVIRHLGGPGSMHTAPAPVPTGSVHSHVRTKPSPGGVDVSRP